MVALVLLPGLDGTGMLLADVAARFGPEVKIIVASYPTDSTLGYAGLETIARTFLPHDQSFYLLGESFSGPLAISIAASRPPGLLGLVLCCTFARSPRPLLGVLRPLLPLLPVSALPSVLIRHFVLGRFATPPLARALAMVLATVSASTLRARARAALSVDVAALLARVDVPVLYLRADEDRVVPAAATRALLSMSPGIRVVTLTAPHFLLQVQPAAAAAAIVDFIGTPSSSAANP